MKYKALKLAPITIRQTTLVFGLLISAFLMARNLPAGSSPEFWTELFTGTGMLFVLHSFPYVLFALLLRKARTSQGLIVGAVVVLALGLVMIAMAVAPRAAVRPEDVPVFDPSIALVAIQIAVTTALARILKTER